jgi:hypothetical protein
LIDVRDRQDETNHSITIYMDGKDSRLFRRLVSRLGSEEAAQNAIILQGLLENLNERGKESEAKKIEKQWKKIVGVTKAEFDAAIEDFSMFS